MVLIVYKAQRTIPTERIPNLIIEATIEFESAGKTLDQCRAIHDLEGAQISDAMLKSLPGGTVDAILRNLLENRASLFAVPFKSEKQK